MKSVYVTVDAQVFLNEEDIEHKMEADHLSESQAVSALAMEKVTDGYNFKVRDIAIHLPSLK